MCHATLLHTLHSLFGGSCPESILVHVLGVFTIPDHHSLPPSPVHKKGCEVAVVTLAKEWNRHVYI